MLSGFFTEKKPPSATVKYGYMYCGTALVTPRPALRLDTLPARTIAFRLYAPRAGTLHAYRKIVSPHSLRRFVGRVRFRFSSIRNAIRSRPARLRRAPG